MAGIETFADLFCGIGGFHYAAAALGLQCTYACDIDEDAARQYRHNFDMLVHGDVTITKAAMIPDHDILFAGFPCQPFSIIGKRGGTNDRRGTLFREIVRIVKAKQPKALILENVRQLVGDNQGKTLDSILGLLAKAGYACTWKVLNALDFGLPQKRERVIIVGLLNGIDFFTWPKPKARTIPLEDILESDPDPKYFVSTRILDKRMQESTDIQGPTIWHENKGGNIGIHPFSCALRAGASYNYLLVDGKRRLTPRELLRLQGFPERFDIIGTDSHIRKQTGNAVPVPMVRAVLRQVMNAESQNEKRVCRQSTLSA